MAFSCFGGKDNGFHTITKAFFLALQMLIFKAGGLQIRQIVVLRKILLAANSPTKIN